MDIKLTTSQEVAQQANKKGDELSNKEKRLLFLFAWADRIKALFIKLYF
jgi:hypothetical protein